MTVPGERLIIATVPWPHAWARQAINKHVVMNDFMRLFLYGPWCSTSIKSRFSVKSFPEELWLSSRVTGDFLLRGLHAKRVNFALEVKLGAATSA